jgi:hypothetical protein
VPETDTLDIVTLVFPVLVNTDVSELDPLTVTVPNERLVGLDVSCVVVAAPVPLTGMVNSEGEAFVVSAMEPTMAVVEVGLNTTLNDTLLPAAMVVDVVSPVTLKPVPVTLTCETVNVALPEFVSVMLWELLPPTATLPKLAEFGVADTAG